MARNSRTRKADGGSRLTYDVVLMVEIPILLIFFVLYVIYLYIFGNRKMKKLSEVSVFKPQD